MIYIVDSYPNILFKYFLSIMFLSELCCSKPKKPPKEPQYKGDLKEGKPHGTGIFRYDNGEVYCGEWVDGFQHGKGRYYYNDGKRYDGEWKKGIRNGHGILFLQNGSRYEAFFINDQMEGKVVKKDVKNRKNIQEVWHNGQRISRKVIGIEPKEEPEQEKTQGEENIQNLLKDYSSNDDSSEPTKIQNKAQKWTKEQVCKWLCQNGLQKYSAGFQDHQILGQYLFQLSDKDLIEIGINSLGHRLNFKRARDQLIIHKGQRKKKLLNVNLKQHLIIDEQDEFQEDKQFVSQTKRSSSNQENDCKTFSERPCEELMRKNSKDIKEPSIEEIPEEPEPELKLIKQVSKITREENSNDSSSESDDEKRGKRKKIKGAGFHQTYMSR